MKIRCKVCGAESEVENPTKAPKCCGEKMAPVEKKPCCK